jgi:serine/threonine protein kinase
MNKSFGTTKIENDLSKIGYSISTEIGRGTYGSVYGGWRDKTSSTSKLGGFDDTVSKGTLVAVKVIDRLSSPPALLNKFLPRELEVCKKLDHRNIIKTFLIHDAGHSIFIITELARSDLLDYIQLNGALRETLCRRLFYDLASGVEYMHSINLVHRDIKSENCLIGHDGVLKLADFGFARDVGIGDSLSDTFCGSTVYAAPEILTATDWYDPRWADAWSCGVVLYAMLTAKMPYAREQLAKFVKFQYVDAPVLPSHISDMAISVVQGILLFNPDKRLKLTAITKKKHDWYSVNALNIIRKKSESNKQSNKEYYSSLHAN